MADQELRIRLSMDTRQPEAALDSVGQAAEKTTTRARDAMGWFTKSSDNAADSVNKVGNSLGRVNDGIANLIKAQIGFGAVKGIATTVTREFEAIADNIGKASREWQAFRASLQGTASLTGNQNSNKFASDEISRAERAHVTPADMKSFRESFLGRASLYVGEGPHAKLGTKDADQFQEMLAAYGASKGISPAEMADFAGGLLAQQKGKTNAKDMMAKVGRTFATLEASSAPVAHLLPSMTRVMAQGMSAEDASRTLAALPEVAPEEEGTHLLRVMAEIRRLNVEGKAGEFGIKEGMNPQQQLEALVGDLRKRSGGNAKALDQALRDVTHEDIAANTLRGMVNQVNFDQWRRVQQAVPEDQLRRSIDEDWKSDAGRHRHVQSRLAVEQARMGLRGDPAEHRRQIAQTELTAGGDMERVHWGQIPVGGVASMLGGASMPDQRINQQAIYRARSELGEGVSATDKFTSLSNTQTLQLLKTLIQRIEENNQHAAKQVELLEQQKRPGGAPAPMPGRPAHQPVRIGG